MSAKNNPGQSPEEQARDLSLRSLKVAGNVLRVLAVPLRGRMSIEIHQRVRQSLEEQISKATESGLENVFLRLAQARAALGPYEDAPTAHEAALRRPERALALHRRLFFEHSALEQLAALQQMIAQPGGLEQLREWKNAGQVLACGVPSHAIPETLATEQGNINAHLAGLRAEASALVEGEERLQVAVEWEYRQLAGGRSEPEWSRADGPTAWARVFNCSYNTMLQSLKNQTVRNRKISARRYEVALDAIPASKRDKFRK
jgi:hypothetical protein